MRKKLISKTYLRDTSEYIIKFDYSKDDYYLCVKKLIKTVPFIVKTGKKIIDDNYYIVEVLPKYENYSMRVFLDDKQNILEYYFDISLENGIDEETNIMYYDDLYNDVVVKENGDIEVLDEDELLDAFNEGKISKENFELATNATKRLVEEIKNNNNFYKNLDIKILINEIM